MTESSRAHELATFLGVALVAVLRAPEAAGWFDGGAAGAAAGLTASPGHGAGAAVLGAVAAAIPIGELAFRVALLGAVALGLAAAGVVALARALVPTAAGAGVIAAALLAVSPAAVATAAGGGGALAAALVVWTLALIVQDRRRTDDDPRRAPAAAAMVGALAALAPLLALVLAVPVARQWRRPLGLVPALAAFALLVLPLVLRGGGAEALASLGTAERAADAPVWVMLGTGATSRAATVLALAGDGVGVVLLFAGLVGLGLGAATGLRGGLVALALAVLAAAAVVLASPAWFAIVPLAVLAAGVGPLAGAVAKLGPAERRPLIAIFAAVPVAAIATVAPRRSLPPGDAAGAPARLAAEVSARVRGGPGLFVATEPAIHAALTAERALAGLRPDLVVVAAADPRAVAATLIGGRVLAADRASVGKLDPRRSSPAGRGFELLAAEPPDTAAVVAAPAPLPGTGGRALAGLLATERARREAARGHLDRAARAVGLAGSRFGAADIAVLAATRPTVDRPAMFGYVPPLSPGLLPPAWLPSLFGDDLAWVAGLPDEPLPAGAPPERRLHAMWRELLTNRRPPTDPAFPALGVAAGRATARLLADLDLAVEAMAAAEANLAAHGEDAGTLLVLGTALAALGGVADSAALDANRTAGLERAVTVLGRAIVADAHQIDAFVLLGLVQVRLGRVDDARATWQRGLTVSPDHPELRDLLK